MMQAQTGSVTVSLAEAVDRASVVVNIASASNSEFHSVARFFHSCVNAEPTSG
jgi:hypothetical protein